MIVAVLFATTILCAGYVPPRLLLRGHDRATALAIGLAPATGLSLTAVAATWLGLLRVPPPGPGIIFGTLALVGIALLVNDHRLLLECLRTVTARDRIVVIVAAFAIVLPIVCLQFGAHGLQAPLSPHDGSFHVETTDAFRRGEAYLGWYPPATAALFGSALQDLPWIDSAQGATELGAGLSVLAQVALSGLAAAVLRDARAAALSALLSGFTYLFLYYTQLWSGWPQMVGLILVCGVWIVADAFVSTPLWALGALAGLLLGATIVSHGTDLYTITVIVALIGMGAWRRVHWKAVPLTIGLAGVIALACALPYMSTLAAWAASGGAYAAGEQDLAALRLPSQTDDAVTSWSYFALDALGVDLPVRVIVLAVGTGVLVRRRVGASAVAVMLVFVAISLAAAFAVDLPPVHAAYAATYPWSVPYRSLTVAAMASTLVAGPGASVAGSALACWSGRIRGLAWRRRASRMMRLLVVTWLALTAAGTFAFVSIPSVKLESYSADDAAVMAWLRAHVAPGEVVVNDGFADAGIWAPYKAGVEILIYRSPAGDADRWEVVRNIARLDQDPAARAAACRLRARYVYYGAKTSSWQEREMPGLDEMRSATNLREAFGSGDAHVFVLDPPAC